MKIVAVERCPNYSRTLLPAALERTLAHLGGIGEFVKPGKTVLLKPNLLKRARPEEAVTTHPEFVRAVVKLVQGAGGRAIIGDSPGAALPHTRGSLIKLYRACGLDRVASETGAELTLDTEYEVVEFPRGRMVKRIEVIRPALSADVIINLPKFKTHVYTRLTGAVKNLFGVVPGLIKPAYHAKLGDLDRFSSMLLDVMEFVDSDLTIVDGIRGMEGDGPGAGPVRDMGVVVAGENPSAVDVALSRIMNIDPLSVVTNRESVKRGILRDDLSDVTVRGEPLAGVVQKGMAVPDLEETRVSFARFPVWLQPALPAAKWLLTSRPGVDRARCIGCGACATVCPVKAIRVEKGKAKISYSRCLRCFCCHETCSEKALRMIRPLFQRLLI